MNRKNLIVRLMLLPFSWLYGMIISMRNFLFDIKLLPSDKFPVPIICIGNLSVGGTGKTPFTEYLAYLLRQHYKVAVLSRGYKRLTKGFIMATPDSTPQKIGDEACQMKSKFPDVIVAVDGNRRRAIRRLLALPADVRPDVILLDDGLQHRYVIPSLTIILTEYDNIYYDDYMLPTGDLRESAMGIYRADFVVVTKCRDTIKPIDLRIIEKTMSLMANQRLYFSGIQYGTMEMVFPSPTKPLRNVEKDDNVLLVTGIANPKPLVGYMRSMSDNVTLFTFPDHHAFTADDIGMIDFKFKTLDVDKRLIICTEKDAVRLKFLDGIPADWKPCLYYIPVTVRFFHDRGDDFDTRVLEHVMTTINIYKENAKN